MTAQPWSLPPELSAGMLETGSTGATWAAASAAWMGLASTTLATLGIVGEQMMASLSSILGMRSAIQSAATPPFMTWLASMAAIAFKQSAINAVVAESYGMSRTSMIPSEQSINNRVRELAAESTNFFGQNTPLIGELNGEYAAYTAQNTMIGTTYGEVITAATLPVPIPPPPPLSNAASAVADGAQAVQGATNMVSSAGQGASQAATQATSAVTDTGASTAGTSSDMTSMLGQFGSVLSSPMQMASSLPQSFQQLLSAPMQMFGSLSGMGDLLNGGSTGSSFAPATLAGSGGLPLGSNGINPASMGAGGGGGVPGMGGMGSPLMAKPTGSSDSVSARNTVLSGVSNVAQEKVIGSAPVGTPGSGMAPGAGAAGAGARDRSRSDSVVLSYAGSGDIPRRAAEGNEREQFA